MEREQIERAAGEYSGSVLGFKDNPVVMNNHKAFMDGAEWRINSVWHDGKSRPKHGKYVLLQLKGHNFKIDMWNDCEYMYLEHYSYSSIERWAYVDDLLPERKEETK